MIPKLKTILIASLIYTTSTIFPIPILADDVPIVAGMLWDKSSIVEKKSYLIGASNFISLEHEYQSRAKNPPTYEQSSVPDFFKHTDNVTLDSAIKAVDEWYKNNPDKKGTPVLTVLWDILVKPNL